MGSSKWHTDGRNSDSYIKIKKYKKSEKNLASFFILLNKSSPNQIKIS